ncbi:MAG TPA: CHAT domain-containing protein [Bacillota bacterium]|nr:CHAT domain-containing protein [Bacillota bacterium]
MEPTNVLVIFANPKGLPNLDLSMEDRVIRECIVRSKFREYIKSEVRHAATIHDVRRALQEFSCRILHFSGHGTEEGLAFEDESGKMKFVAIEALAQLLSAHSPPLEAVLINACNPEPESGGTDLGVPYTLSVKGRIADQAAIEFTRGFYDAIGAGESIEFAYDEGCHAMRLTGYSEAGEPVLFRNSNACRRFKTEGKSFEKSARGKKEPKGENRVNRGSITVKGNGNVTAFNIQDTNINIHNQK